MCKWGTRKPVNVIRRANPSVEDGWHRVMVDSCIADEIQSLNNEGVITLNSCCGHGKAEAQCLIAKESIEKSKELGYKPRIYKDTEMYSIKLKMKVDGLEMEIRRLKDKELLSNIKRQ